MTLGLSQIKIAAELLIEKSDKNMEQAVRTADMGYWDLVANRLYYAVFHAVNALLMIDGIKTGTHKGSSVQFGKSYVLTGQFSREDGVLYSQLQTMREKADYQNVFCLNEEDGRNLIEAAEKLRHRIILLVQSKIEDL